MRDWSQIVNTAGGALDSAKVEESEVIAAVADLPEEEVRPLCDQLGLRVVASGQRKAIAGMLLASSRIIGALAPTTAQ